MKKTRIGLLLTAALLAWSGLAAAQDEGATEDGAGDGEAGDSLTGESSETSDGSGDDLLGGGGDDLLGGGGEAKPDCTLDPAACEAGATPAAGEPAPPAELDVQMYAVQQIYALRKRRVELMPYWSVTLNDQYVSHPGPGLAINYYITNVLAVGINGTVYHPFNSVSDFTADVRQSARVSVPLTEYSWAAAGNFTYVPAYGKFSGFGDFIFTWDVYLVGGVGAISTRPIPVIDPDYRFFDWTVKVSFNLGLGARIFFNRWLALDLEIRDYIFNEELENIEVLSTPQERRDQSTWYGDNELTNNVQAQVGLSIFVPFSFKYRLPK